MLLLFICPLLTLDGEGVIIHKMAVWWVIHLLVSSFFVFTSQNQSIIFLCKLILITLTTSYLILYHSLTVYCAWSSCTCCAVIRFDVDTILRRNCSTLPVIHILCLICVIFSYGLQKFKLFCPEVVIRYKIIGKHNYPILIFIDERLSQN